VSARRVILSVQPPDPFGDVALVPATLSGRPEANMAGAIVARVDVPMAAEVYGWLHCSPSLTAAALAKLMKQLRGSMHGQHED
jgi:hypothetical protein